MRERTPSFRRHWALPVVVLTGAALVVFWGFYLLDYYLTARILTAPPAGPTWRRTPSSKTMPADFATRSGSTARSPIMPE